MDAIRVRGLVKRYGELVALNGLDLEVKEGEVYALLGPNGAGKTTLVEILECLRPFDSGEAWVLGYRVGEPGACRRIKERIGVLPQDFSAIDRLTVRENLRLFASLYDESLDIDELISLLGLEDKADKQFHTLSGGLKRRVGVAVALVNNPELLFLDEPTTGLDPKARREVWEVVEKLREMGKTVLLTTHYMEEAERLADRIGIIVKGRIIAEGTPRELIERYVGRKIVKAYGEVREAAERIKAAGIRVDFKDDELEAEPTSPQQLAEIIEILSSLGVARIEVESGSLEDVFLRLTSARITEEGELA